MVSARIHAPSRRELMLGSGVLFAWTCLPRLARAEGRDPRLLVVILRGALDGLAAVAPVGDRDWLANGALFAAYHVHLPWMIPVTLVDTFLIAYPTKRYGSAWIGVAVHSSQTIVFTLLLLTLVV